MCPCFAHAPLASDLSPSMDTSTLAMSLDASTRKLMQRMARMEATVARLDREKLLEKERREEEAKEKERKLHDVRLCEDDCGVPSGKYSRGDGNLAVLAAAGRKVAAFGPRAPSPRCHLPESPMLTLPPPFPRYPWFFPLFLCSIARAEGEGEGSVRKAARRGRCAAAGRGIAPRAARLCRARAADAGDAREGRGSGRGTRRTRWWETSSRFDRIDLIVASVIETADAAWYAWTSLCSNL